ncbi:hypothetical protein RRG08_052954 [Elysia crispata]|uniref:Uncharacterized protein n=1 Tax=Elysia crispata TaxID=231223 RepID=A0AAE0ZJL5_9GAST|nr:hypothetical protein RRG08_052954 [Elysia crispata]
MPELTTGGGLETQKIFHGTRHIFITSECHKRNYRLVSSDLLWSSDDAFLCQEDHVQAMRVCFRAIELNKPALLTDISPHLLRHGQPTSKNDRSLSAPSCRRPGFETLTGAGGAGPLPAGLEASNGRAGLTRTLSGWGTMGNKQPRLDVSYSGHLSRSNLSLTVDPSLGASSLLHQKTLSSPYFVSSLDSPRVLQHLHGDIRDAIRTSASYTPGTGSPRTDQRSNLDPMVSTNSNSSETLAQPDGTPGFEYVRDTGSAPELRVLAEPEVAVVTGQRRATVIASGPVSSSSGKNDPEGRSGSDSTACNSVSTSSTSSTSTLSTSQDDVVGSGHGPAVCGGNQESTGEDTSVCEPGSSSAILRPKSHSDALVYCHHAQDTITDAGRGSARRRSSSNDSPIPHHNEATSSLPGTTANSSRISQDTAVGLDATYLNTNLTCETEYGPDGVLFGFSPPEDRVSPSSERPARESEFKCNTDDERRHSFKGDDLPEPGDSPSGSPVHKDVSYSDNATDAGQPLYSPEGGAKPKTSSGQSEPILAVNDPLLSPCPPMLTEPSRSSASPFNFPQVHSPQSGAFAASPPHYTGIDTSFTESEADLYCFSPPVSPRTDGEAVGRRELALGSANAVSVPMKLPRGGGSVYIPGRGMGMSLDRGLPGISALASAQANDTSTQEASGSGRDPLQAVRVPLDARTSSPLSSGPPRKGHKRWVSDTSVIQVNQQDMLTAGASTKQAEAARGHFTTFSSYSIGYCPNPMALSGAHSLH